ncbi:MAG: sugar phosphate nucleotidyltransferase [Armatimonadota bacterium]|nr:sugar phosphate nucleotidyltransferase [Armatimonadota bacterium]MDR7485220.1 sugar phosphate nucleotidyltransferase [Armatimonadota bacterium]MDR7534001.1 sugar phosphate nucleotidyltransferase [Armatimonadota bacterium]MDR7536532.1 sugar phosphate nucleotidyltransferase [Armatimonadota bacterium]
MIPAAGRATRLGPLPFSKPLFPIRVTSGRPGAPAVTVVGAHLLARMRQAGIGKAYVLVARGQWDMASYFGDGTAAGVRLAYIAVDATPSTVHTLDRAHPFVEGVPVALGFPDILFRPPDLYSRIIAHQQVTGADVVLAVLPTDRPQRMDMVDLDAQGTVRDIVIKPQHTTLRFTWTAAVWTPAFTRFLHAFLARAGPDDAVTHGQWEGRELFVGDVIRAALREGMRVEGVTFPEGATLDIGTPEDLARALEGAAAFEDDALP